VLAAAAAKVEHPPRWRGRQCPLKERRLALEALGPGDEVAVGDAAVGVGLGIHAYLGHSHPKTPALSRP